ncbi:hypothetical protein [Virgibacillus oceani]|uniref:Uncharacterized protein n=1 Tax=Virgibacillus oceani TaxID=1479511 RepID=A0A917LXY9_9BACI|nr:hypothetical protein [Virgibacillus oceani]GGG66236.1 hypothetical protein GCM10011398_07340 [Virgibacillus oceani]
MMEFLYFPEDKTEYIPGVISLIIFMIGAAVTMYIFIKKSKKEAQLVEKQYNLNASKNSDSDKETL